MSFTPSLYETQLVPQTVQANGLNFSCLVQGEGPLLLCLHGFADDAWSFAPLLPLFARAGYRAVAPFMRGTAPSALAPDGDYSLRALAQDVIALAEHFGAGRATVVGHDWGAIAGYAAANLRPDRISRLVTAGMPHPRRLLLRPSAAQLQRARCVFGLLLPGWAEWKLPQQRFARMADYLRAASPHSELDAAQFDRIRSAYADPQRLKAAMAYHRGLLRVFTDAECWRLATQAVSVPTLTIYADRDGAIGSELFAGQAHLFTAGLQLQRMSGLGHFMHREQPAEFARLALEFLKI